MKSSQIRKWISYLTTFILLVTLIVMVFVVVNSKLSGGEPQIFGYQLKTVLSGSMEPEIKTGSIIAVKPGVDSTQIKKGDVITFKIDEKNLVTHRVINVVKKGNRVMYRTKGDNNHSADMNAVLSENVVAEYHGFTIPYIGYIINFINSKNGAFLFIVPGILLFGYAVFTIWKATSEIFSNNKRKKGSIEKIV